MKTIGTGIAGVTAVTGSASAGPGSGNKGAYGDGNGLDVFLNEEAEFKENPIWDGEIADMRGDEVVDVAVGALTSVDPPEGVTPPPFGLPFAFAPQVVKVSPGATVRWTWVSNPYNEPIPHDVTSLVDDEGNVILEPHAGQRFHHHDQYTPVEDGEDINPTFQVTFTDRGNHLYYCTPHGAPFESHGYSNLVGMRGAVQVAGKSL